jgi:excisionase family DNA binding protein
MPNRTAGVRARRPATANRPPRRLLDLHGVAEELSCSVDTVDRYLRSGSLAFIKLSGGQRRVTPEDLDAAIARWRRVEAV